MVGRDAVSLDFYLQGPEVTETCDGVCRECNERHEHQNTFRPTLFSANCTHNLGAMADAAGVYEVLWRSGERHWQKPTKARDLVPVLTEGLAKLRADPAHYRTFDPPNKWGSYESFVPFVEKCLAACIEYPDADVESNT